MQDIYKHDYELESLHSDDIADALNDARKTLQISLLDNTVAISRHSLVLSLLGDIQYPFVCYKVDGQTDNACKLTAPPDLPAEIRGIYLIDVGLANIYSTQNTLKAGAQACVYSHFGKSGTVTVSGMSAMRFSTTRPGTPTSQHNFGKAFDVKLQGRMKSDGTKYDQMACAFLCLYCVEAGATRVFFSDQTVVDAVNKATNKTVCSNIGGHENHVHMDCR